MSVLEPIRATVGGMLVLHDVPERPMVRLIDAFALPNPKFVRARNLGFSTHGEPKTIEVGVEMPDRSLHLPRGAIGKVRKVLGQYGYGFQLKADGRSDGDPIGPFPDVPLRPYQVEGVACLRMYQQGLIVLPCGCGKSRLGVGACAAIGRTTLILVETADLADQWDENIRTLLGIVPGWVGAGRCESNAGIVIGILDSVLPFMTKNPAWGARFGLVIEDEVHHAPARSTQAALGLLPARFRLGLTATPYREDGLDLLIEWSFGDVLLERSTEEMIRHGFLERGMFERVRTGWRFEYDGPETKRLSAMEEALSQDMMRNCRIVERVVREAHAGETVLVLAQRREHVTELATWITAQGVPALGLTGNVSKKKRKKGISDLRDGGVQVIVATSLADEGLDIKRLSRIVLAHPGKARAATVQRLGRLLRKLDSGVTKRPRIIDFVDDEVETLARRAQERARHWKKEGAIDITEKPKPKGSAAERTIPLFGGTP